MSINFGEVNLKSQQILERISEQSIYEYYLNENIKNGKLIKCCFHKDSTPSLGFYLSSSGELNYKCFGCGKQGNIFKFVSELHNINFGQTLRLLQNTFKLSKNDSRENSNYSFKKEKEISTFLEEGNSKTQLIPTFKTFSKVDYDYWTGRYHLPLELVASRGIRACRLMYIISKMGKYHLFAEHHDKNPIYCWKAGSGMKGYRPYSDKKGKWISNTTNYDIQGLEYLPERGELLIITSSMKDILFLTMLGYNAIALGGEGNRIPEKILDYLWACFDNIIVFYDNDKAGLEYGLTLSNEIGAGNIHIPIEFSDTKDISDYGEKYDVEESARLMKQLI